jgi:hypothetical protein
VLGALAWYDLNRAYGAALAARDQVADAVEDPGALRTQAGRDRLRAELDDAGEHLTAAENRLRGSVSVRAAIVIPGIPAQRRGSLRLLDDAQVVTGVARRLLDHADRMAAGGAISRGRVNLDEVGELARALADAAAALEPLDRQSTELWGALSRARTTFNTTVASTIGRLEGSSRSLDAARTFLGADSSRRYFLALQNNAEMRDQGIVLSYGVVRFDDGQLHVEQTGRIDDLTIGGPVPVAVPPGTQALFGDLQPARTWQSVNATADFAWTGQTMVEMYRAATGQRLDGAIALDVPAIASMLKVLGPTDVEGIGTLTAANTGRVLLNDLYEQFPDPRERRVRQERLDEVAAAVIAKIGGGSYDALALGREVGAAAAGGHVRVWSANPAEEAAFERAGIAGGPAVERADRTFHLALLNNTVAKLDYFVDPRVEMRVYVGDGGTAVIRTRVTVVNRAPPRPRPSYQFGGYGLGLGTPGQYLSRVVLWGPHGSSQLNSVEESGLVASQKVASVGGGEQQTVEFQTAVPNAVRNGRLELRLVPQPRLRPASLDVHLEAPGWQIGGDATVRRRWGRTLTVSWSLE